MKKILLLAAFLAVLLAIPSCEGVLTSNDAGKAARVYHEMKEEGYANNEVICDFASPLCESVALYIAVVGCGYYEDQPVV